LDDANQPSETGIPTHVEDRNREKVPDSQLLADANRHAVSQDKCGDDPLPRCDIVTPENTSSYSEDEPGPGPYSYSKSKDNHDDRPNSDSEDELELNTLLKTTLEAHPYSDSESEDDSECTHCGNSGGGVSLKRCSRCRSVQYCSKTCQSDDWIEHKLECAQACERAQAFASRQELSGAVT
jgi:hypothetical protein